MKKTSTSNHYRWVEANISQIGPKTYRIRVGKFSGYSATRDGARAVKRTFLNKMG